jgi:hypothetical protein
MPASATLATALDDRAARALAEPSGLGLRFKLIDSARTWLRHLGDRLLAGFAVHDRTRYRGLVAVTAKLVDYTGPLDPLLCLLRAHDPQGLGVWLLARLAPRPRFDDLCRRAIAARGGPPRPVARLLELSLATRRVCWFGESGGFSALAAESLLSASVASALAAIGVASRHGKPDWPATLKHLTFISGSLQSSVRAIRHATDVKSAAADEAVNLSYQAVNVARRAMNRTDLLAVDERLVSEITRLTLAAADASCQAALELCTHLMPTSREGAISPGGKLASVARTIDALLARVAVAIRDATRRPDATESLARKLDGVLDDLRRSLRAWGVDLANGVALEPNASIETSCGAACELLEASADTLDAWAALHEIFRGNQPNAESPRGVPLWASRLVSAITGRATPQEVADSLNQLAGPADHAIAGAVSLAALRCNSLHLRRELWKLIRAVRTPDVVRVLSFQLFWRLMSPAFERSVRQ